MGTDRLIEDLQRWQEQFAALPEPLAYIVLDHAHDPREPITTQRDGKGRKYIVCSPAVLDEMKHVKSRLEDSTWGLLGVPIYRRKSMQPDFEEPDGGSRS